MGGFWSFLFSRKKPLKVVMVGLGAAGKTTALYAMAYNQEIKSTTPTLGHNVEVVTYKGLELNVWDIGGQDRFRAVWEAYILQIDALIFVVDSADVPSLMEAKKELHRLVALEAMTNAPILVLANKQDMDQALSPEEVEAALELQGVQQRYRVEGSIATSLPGLKAGLDWMKAVCLKEKKIPERKQSQKYVDNMKKKEERQRAKAELQASKGKQDVNVKEKQTDHTLEKLPPEQKNQEQTEEKKEDEEKKKGIENENEKANEGEEKEKEKAKDEKNKEDEERQETEVETEETQVPQEDIKSPASEDNKDDDSAQKTGDSAEQETKTETEATNGNTTTNTAAAASAGSVVMLTVAEVAKELFLAEHEVIELLEAKTLKGRKIKRLGWRISKAALDEFTGSEDDDAGFSDSD